MDTTKWSKQSMKHKIAIDLTGVPDVFHGVSIKLMDLTQAKLLIRIAAVEDIKEVTPITRGPTFPGSILSKPLMTLVDQFPPHLMTNISMLHNQCIFSAGIKVALIAFGLSFVPNNGPQFE
ncbi:hypothetical protein VP01_8113g1 [Puccinia sorghi]|uniref:Uncharacterized protein n=1 Tax=Puccinia sorghi TaxID=27349 RepID=A0A0L6UA74_9BASI|nr:hypothetical protein VP01_8113g1 [Puccinia sorghi]